MGSELGPCGSEGIVESPRKGSKAQFASALKPSLAFVKAELNFYEYIQQTLKNIHKKDAHYIKGEVRRNIFIGSKFLSDPNY